LEEVIGVHDAGTMDEAVATAFELARPSGVVVLAPAWTERGHGQRHSMNVTVGAVKRDKNVRRHARSSFD
jgi:hypothetical protein